MKSDIIQIDNQGRGFEDAISETQKVAEYQGLDEKNSLRLQLCTEEMLGLIRSVTGEMEASFWIEAVEKTVCLNMTTKTVMDLEKRYQLIESTTARKNEITNSFLGKLRDFFEQAMASESDRIYYEYTLPEDIASDVSDWGTDDPEWDRYERSVLQRFADDIKIAIRGDLVHMTVSKTFA